MGSVGPPRSPEGPPGGLGGIGRIIRRAGRGREAHLESLKGSRGPTGGPRGFRRPTQKLWALGSPMWRSRRTTRWSWWGQKTHPEVRQWSGGPPGLKWVGRPTRRSKKPTRRSGRVGWPIRMSRRSTQRSGRGREAHPDVREGLGSLPGGPEVPPGCLGGVGRPTRRSGKGLEDHPEVREARPEICKGSEGPL